jgi:hypothetical protein
MIQLRLVLHPDGTVTWEFVDDYYNRIHKLKIMEPSTYDARVTEVKVLDPDHRTD